MKAQSHAIAIVLSGGGGGGGGGGGARVAEAEAKAKFREKALELHPDKVRQRGEADAARLVAAATRFRACKDAHEVFGDAAKLAKFHANYDVIGTTLPFPDQSDEVLDYASDDDVHIVRDRAAWTTSRRKLDDRVLLRAGLRRPQARS